MQSADRLHALDAVRASALLLGVALHAAQPFVGGMYWLTRETPDGVIAWICMPVATADTGDEPSGRHSPRLHHVRGHLVRREQRVFWRVPHLRGSASRGAVRSRTVCLSFARSSERELRV